MVGLKRLLAILALALLPQIASAQQITNYPPASTPLSGSEIIYLVQNGVSMQTTVGSLLPTTAAGLFAAPPPIGSTTPNSGAFSTLSASGNATVGGTLGVTGAATLGGTLNVGTGSGNAGINQGSTGFVFALNLGSPTSQLRIQSSAGVQLLDVANANIQANVPLLLQPPTAWVSQSTNSGIFQNSTMTGTSGGGGSIYNMLQVYDHVDTSASQQGGETLNVGLIMNSASSKGPKNAFGSSFQLTATSGNTAAPGGSYTSGQFSAYAGVNDNGTNLTTGARGDLFGINVIASLGPSATFYDALVGDEHDIIAQAGSSMRHKFGETIVQLSGDKVAGSLDDIAFEIGNGGVVGVDTVGWQYGISFGSNEGDFPMQTTGTMIGAQTQSGSMNTANGIDWHLVTFSANAYNDGHIQMTGAGDLLANSATALATAATAGFFHLPHTAAAPTGTPTNTTPGCEWNTASHTMNCYDGASWYHFTGTSGAS